MDPLFFNILIDHEVEEIILQNEVRLQQRMLRDCSNPFSLPENNFRGMFRLTPVAALDLFQEIEPFMEELHDQQRLNIAIPNYLKFCCALYFFSKGSYQSNIGQDYNISMSQPSVSRSVQLVTDIISTYILNRYVKFSRTDEEMEQKKAMFIEQFNFPHVIGCIDGTHIAIIQPKEDDPERPGLIYLNRKGFFSINTQLICDANLQILGVSARFPRCSYLAYLKH